MEEKREKTFSLEFETGLTKKDKDICEKKLRVGKSVYNACLNEALKRLKSYKRDPRIIKLNSITRDLFIIQNYLGRLLKQFSEDDINYVAIKRQLESTVNTYNGYKEKYSRIRKEYGWEGKYSLADFRKEQLQHFKGAIGSMVVSKLSERACRAVEQIGKGKAEKVNFVRNDDDFSIEGATNNDGIYIRNGMLCFNRNTSLAIKPSRENDDKYYAEALQNRIKYCRLLSRTIRGKKRYYVHVLLEGTPPNHRVYGDSKIELLDVKISHLEMQIDGKKEVIGLAPGCKNPEERIAEIERKMDASRRISNPGNYREDKTIRKGSKRWTYSKNYMKLAAKRKELYRSMRERRKVSHNELSNRILSKGSDITIRSLSYIEQQKRFKKTIINEKTGLPRSKKRQGKNIGNRAPAEFISILERKLKYIDKELIRVSVKNSE